MKSARLTQSRGLNGSVTLPADKSISHRAAMFAALADGESILSGYSDAADPQSTLSCLQSLSVSVERVGNDVRIRGTGLHGLQSPIGPLDCGNSGTTLRLLSGILAGQNFDSILIGDSSLSARPMKRIADPLRLMLADVRLTEGHAPVVIRGKSPLKGIMYRLPVPSAQVKSCVLLAGLFADSPTTVIEPVRTRDHTERLLGLQVESINSEQHIRIEPDTRIEPRNWLIPRDFSAAAFFLVAGSIIPSSSIRLSNVGVNPTRTALLPVLRSMGAHIEIRNGDDKTGEPVADLYVKSAELKGIDVPEDLIPNLIDEIPILALAATQANGITRIRGASELRVKETDRIAAMVQNLRSLGANIEEHEDGMTIEGPTRLKGSAVKAFDDHRIAMSMGIAGLLASGETTIDDADCAAISFPAFWDELEALES